MIIVILSAFGGRLRSDPMEWPAETPDIRLPISRNVFGRFDIGMDALPTQGPPRIKVGIFTPTGRYEVLSGGRTAAVYELTDI